MSNVTVEQEFWSDPRARRVARLMRWSIYETVGRFVSLWQVCTNLGVSELPVDDLADAIGLLGDEALAAFLEAANHSDKPLVRLVKPGRYLVAGADPRCLWRERHRLTSPEASRLGGEARAKSAKRDASGKFVPASIQPGWSSQTTSQNQPVQPPSYPSYPSSLREEEPPQPGKGVNKPKPAKRANKPTAQPDLLVSQLWDLQNRLRQEAIPGTRPLKPTAENLARVADRLAAGHDFQDCEHVLRVYAAEARAKPDARQWFNGESNWRRDNFARALGRVVPGAGGARERTEEEIAESERQHLEVLRREVLGERAP